MATILVTAGPTREYLDGVRYLANGSSGRMGFAIASSAVAQGHSVRLVAGPTDLEPPGGVMVERVVSARDMHRAALRAFDGADIAFGVAAVADFRPARELPGKPAKSELPTTIELVPNPDVVASLGEKKGGRLVVGFALEDGTLSDGIERARLKLARKSLDFCVLNAVEAMGATTNRVCLVFADGHTEELPRMSKDRLGSELVKRAVSMHAGFGGTNS